MPPPLPLLLLLLLLGVDLPAARALLPVAWPRLLLLLLLPLPLELLLALLRAWSAAAPLRTALPSTARPSSSFATSLGSLLPLLLPLQELLLLQLSVRLAPLDVPRCLATSGKMPVERAQQACMQQSTGGQSVSPGCSSSLLWAGIAQAFPSRTLACLRCRFISLFIVEPQYAHRCTVTALASALARGANPDRAPVQP